MNSKVDDYFDRLTKWKEELSYLRSIVQIDQLNEDYKWNNPCYTYKGKNVFIIAAFKNHFSLSFFKGALLKDPLNLLNAPGEHSSHIRMFKFTSIQEIQASESIILDYIKEAIEIEKKGLKVIPKKTSIDLPEELRQTFSDSKELKTAFEALTPGRQRGYLLFFSQAKQSETRLRRIKKYEDRILNGYGMDDCVCGRSKRMPGCDGSHKLI
jgi:uncharacterized protein YdeI (YjbR/CyaY-like superfamily)